MLQSTERPSCWKRKKMKGLKLWIFAIMILASAQGGEKEQKERLMEAVKLEEEEVQLMQCFRCDLGFWDACYTTETTCKAGERCYTGRGKAADVLDVKLLGCAKAEECNVQTTVDLYANNTIFVMTKHCCDTPFCNSAHTLSVHTLWCVTAAVLTSWHLAEASTRSH